MSALVVLVWVGLSIGAPGPGEPTQEAPRSQPAVPLPVEPIDLADVPILGDPDAPVGLLVFSDFQCPFCGRFAREALSVVGSSHVAVGRLFVGYIHVPIFRIHPMAGEAARASECARQQGRFWEMHDALFAGSDWITTGFQEPGVSVGLDGVVFRECMIEAATIQRVLHDVERARRLGIVSTPTLIIGTRDLEGRFIAQRVEVGALSAEELGIAVDAVAALVR